MEKDHNGGIEDMELIDILNEILKKQKNLTHEGIQQILEVKKRAEERIERARTSFSDRVHIIFEGNEVRLYTKGVKNKIISKQEFEKIMEGSVSELRESILNLK